MSNLYYEFYEEDANLLDEQISYTNTSIFTYISN